MKFFARGCEGHKKLSWKLLRESTAFGHISMHRVEEREI